MNASSSTLLEHRDVASEQIDRKMFPSYIVRCLSRRARASRELARIDARNLLGSIGDLSDRIRHRSLQFVPGLLRGRNEKNQVSEGIEDEIEAKLCALVPLRRMHLVLCKTQVFPPTASFRRNRHQSPVTLCDSCFHFLRLYTVRFFLRFGSNYLDLEFKSVYITATE